MIAIDLKMTLTLQEAARVFKVAQRAFGDRLARKSHNATLSLEAYS
jgi:hypothetical protein